MGAGTITMPYIISLTGIGLGTTLVVVGAALSHYTSSLLVSDIAPWFLFNVRCCFWHWFFTQLFYQIRCNTLCGLKTYEDFAELAFGGKKWRTFAAVVSMIALLGFVTAYISLAKTLMPSIVNATVSDPSTLPYWLQMNKLSQIVWASVFAFGILLPMACFRELSMLRFTSFFGVTCIIIIMFVLSYEFSMNQEVVPQPPSSQLAQAEYFNFSGDAIINAVPFVIFLYLYQPNIPHTYSELRIKTPIQMKKVLVRANTVAAAVFLLVGIFGYLIFADRAKEQLQD